MNESAAVVRMRSRRAAGRVACIVCATLLGGCVGPQGPRPTDSRGAAPEDLWAIRCVTVSGPNRFRSAARYADGLKQVARLNPNLVQVFDENAESTVYYGRYRRTYDARRKRDKYKPDPLKDLALIRELSFPSNDRSSGSAYLWPFHLATVASLPSARPGAGRWNLSNAPGYYSLQIGVFYNTDGFHQRRLAAEQYCRSLREDDGVQAYYFHGPAMSIVCVGAFDKSAIDSVEQTDPLTGRVRFSERIVDEKMLNLQRAYPYNLENGRTVNEVRVDPATGKRVREPHYSFPVVIPGKEESSFPRG